MITRMDTDQFIVMRLQPNNSSNSISRLLFLVVVGGTTLIIAAGWALVGAWLILPFAGLEVLVLLWATRKVAHATRYQQVISLSSIEIKVESGLDVPEQQKTFLLAQSYLEIVEEPTPFSVPQLWLRGPDDELRLGSFLNDQDIRGLIEQLKSNGLSVLYQRWWEQR